MSVLSVLLTESLTQSVHIAGYYAKPESKMGKLYAKYMALSPAARFGIGLTEDIVTGYINASKEDGTFNTIKDIAVYGGASSSLGMITDHILHKHGPEIRRQLTQGSAKESARYLAVTGRRSIRQGVSKFRHLPQGGKLGLLAGVGAYAGIIGSGNDGPLGTVRDAAVGAGMGIAMGAVGSYIAAKHGKTVSEIVKGKKHILEFLGDGVQKVKVTMSDVAKKEVSSITKEKLTQLADQRAERFVKVGGGLVAGVIGLTALLDVSNGLHHKQKADQEKARQEKKLQEDSKKEKQAMRSMFGYNYVNYGDIVKELWDQRIGHYKIGNAKFS